MKQLIQKYGLALILALIVPGIAAAQCPPTNPDESTGGIAEACNWYANSGFFVELPSWIRDGSTDILDYLYASDENADHTSFNIVGDMKTGIFGQDNIDINENFKFVAVSNGGDAQHCSIHYGTETAGDPWWEFDAGISYLTTGAQTELLGQKVRIPNNRNWNGTTVSADSFFCGMSVDSSHQDGAVLYALFRASPITGPTGIEMTGTASGCGTTAATACALSAYMGSAVIQTGNIYDFNDVTIREAVSAGHGALRVAALAPVTTIDEVINGEIDHPLFYNAECSEPSTVYTNPQKTKNVYPGAPQDGGKGDFPCNHDDPIEVPICSDPNNTSTCYSMKSWTDWAGSKTEFTDHFGQAPNGFQRAPHGGLFFFDYTDAQLTTLEATMPEWAFTYLEAATKYGMYSMDTKACCPLYSTRHTPQASQAEIDSGIAATSTDLYVYYTGQGLTSTAGSTDHAAEWVFSESWIAEIPNMAGPRCPTSTCDPFYHLHLAAECVSLWRFSEDYGGTVCAGQDPPGAPPATISWTTQPTSAVEDTNMTAFAVTLSDAASGVTCNIALNDPGSVGATVSGTTGVTSNGSGVCTWSDIQVSDAGTFSFRATASGYALKDSNSFTITSEPGSQPAGSITVTDTFTIDTYTTAADNQDLSVTVASGDNLLVLCVVPDSGALGGTATLQTGGGLEMTLVGGSGTISGGEIVEMWYYLSPPVGTYNVRYSKGWGSQMLMGAYALADADTEGPLRDADNTNSSGGQGTSGATALDLQSGDLVISCWAAGRTADPVNVVEDEGTEAWDIEGLVSGIGFHNESHYYAADASTETPSVTWTNSAHFGGVAAAFIPASTITFSDAVTGQTKQNGANGFALTWSGGTSTCRIDYSVNQGTTWTTAGSAACSAGTFNLRAPAGTVRVRITDSSGNAVSSGNFTVVGDSLGAQ